jgi:HSP20 family protein
MQEEVRVQRIPVKVYRSADRLMVAAPMPGLQPENIKVEVTADNQMVIQGDLRGVLKDIKDLLIDEWNVGSYYRTLPLPDAVDAQRANVTYGNGVLVAALPVSARTVPAVLGLDKVRADHGERTGNAGHPQERMPGY